MACAVLMAGLAFFAQSGRARLQKALPTQTVAAYCRVLYQQAPPDQDAEAAKRLHPFALRYVHSTPKGRLRSDLEAVFRARGLHSVEGTGAAYLMAMHGIDLHRNLDRLFHKTMINDMASDSMEDLPAAFCDIALRQDSREAARDLLGMDSDGAVAEIQAYEVYKLFLGKPLLLASAAASHKKLGVVLVESISHALDNYTQLARVHEIARLESKRTSGQVRQIFRALAKLRPSFEHSAP